MQNNHRGTLEKNRHVSFDPETSEGLPTLPSTPLFHIQENAKKAVNTKTVEALRFPCGEEKRGSIRSGFITAFQAEIQILETRF